MLSSPALARTRPRPGHPERAGAIGRGCLTGLAALVLLVLVVGGVACSGYNGLVTDKTASEAAWSEVQNQYRRRFELVPNLVSTVQGAANFERSTLEQVTEARASVGRVQLPETLPTDPAQLEQYLKAQQSLGAALGRLLAVAESYPDLKSSQSFLSLQDQLEGTENRIAVARRDFIERVRLYNTRVARFPTNLLAGLFGFEPLPNFSIPAEELAAPKVEFDFGKK